MVISKEQANKVAYYIFENLDEYINSHSYEFQKYLDNKKKGSNRIEKEKEKQTNNINKVTKECTYNS